MNKSILNGKVILAVDDEPDVLAVLEEEIHHFCPDCKFDKATTFEEARERIASFTYDLVILDIMGVRGFDLLDRAVAHNIPVAMLTAHALSPEAMKRSFELKAKSYLPKEKLGEIVPFLEDVMEQDFFTGWRRLFEKLKGFFDARFGANWENKVDSEWKQWGQGQGPQ